MQARMTVICIPPPPPHPTPFVSLFFVPNILDSPAPSLSRRHPSCSDESSRNLTVTDDARSCQPCSQVLLCTKVEKMRWDQKKKQKKGREE